MFLLIDTKWHQFSKFVLIVNIFQVRKRPFHWSLSKYHVRFWAALWFSGNYNISIIFSVGFSRIWSKFETGFNEMAHNWDLTFRIQSLSGSGFSEKWILTILSNFLSTDKLTNKKSWAILQNFNSWMIKLTNHWFCQITKFQIVIYITVNFIIQGLKFCEIAQLFFRQFLW